MYIVISCSSKYVVIFMNSNSKIHLLSEKHQPEPLTVIMPSIPHDNYNYSHVMKGETEALSKLPSQSE